MLPLRNLDADISTEPVRIKLNAVANLAVKVNTSQRTLTEKSHKQLTVTDLILPNFRAQTSALRQQFRRVVFNS